MITEKDFIKGLTDELLSVEHFSRKDVLDTFSKFVDNKYILKQCIESGELHFDYVKYHTIFDGTIFEDGISEIVKLAKQSFHASPERTACVLADCYIGIVSGLARYTQTIWSSSPQIGNSRPDVFVKTAFIRLGDMIENSLKPYLFMINEFRCIASGSTPNQKKLGTVVDAILQINPIFKAIYSELLMGITVSQWRNIADHGDYKYTPEGIEVEFGSDNNRKKKIITVDELRCLLVIVDNILYMNKMARTLLSIEYHGRYSAEAGRNEKSSYTRKDDQMMQIVETSYAYGLTVREMNLDTVPCEIKVNQYFGPIRRKEIEDYLKIMCSIISEPYFFIIYRKDKIEYTAEIIDSKLVVLKYVVSK